MRLRWCVAGDGASYKGGHLGQKVLGTDPLQVSSALRQMPPNPEKHPCQWQQHIHRCRQDHNGLCRVRGTYEIFSCGVFREVSSLSLHTRCCENIARNRKVNVINTAHRSVCHGAVHRTPSHCHTPCPQTSSGTIACVHNSMYFISL
jgi:hypothetical protein